jgi:drug/metabolite transporter (DMT)-like permease
MNDFDNMRLNVPESVATISRNVRSTSGGPISSIDLALITLVVLLWALCFPLIAIGLAGAPPLAFAALRSLVAGAGLLLPSLWLRLPMPRGRQAWLGLLAVGFTSTGMGFAGMFLAGGLVSPGLATVLANTQPLIAAVLAYFALGERLGPRRRLGLTVGFIGILFIALPGFGSGGAGAGPESVAYILIGTLGVALGNVMWKRLAGRVNPVTSAGWQFVFGGVPLLLASSVFERSVEISWTPSFVIVLLALALPGTALAFALWFWLLSRNSLTRLNTFTFLTPAVALFIGVLAFAESLQIVETAGILLALIGAWWARGEKRRSPEPNS